MPESRRSLSREAFAEAAVAFVDEHGFDALTMRALGDAMGVHATAVYRYFSGKDELVEAALGAMLAESGVVIPEQGTPRERIAIACDRWYAPSPSFLTILILITDY